MNSKLMNKPQQLRTIDDTGRWINDPRKIAHPIPSFHLELRPYPHPPQYWIMMFSILVLRRADMVVDPCGGFSEGPKENSLINKFDFNMFWHFCHCLVVANPNVTHFSNSQHAPFLCCPRFGVRHSFRRACSCRIAGPSWISICEMNSIVQFSLFLSM